MSSQHGAPSVVLISQVYVPDPASVGQHMADAAAELVRRGARVRVYAANRGYDAPGIRYLRTETRDGVGVRRLPLSSFGKRSLPVRVIGQLSFVLQASLRTLFVPHLDVVVISSSPPMAPAAGLLLAAVRRVPVVFWSMDLNPDQAIATGAISSRSPWTGLLSWVNARMLRRAEAVVALDHFMADRLEEKADLGDTLTIIPPWPHEDALEEIPHESNPFRAEHALENTFVVMYSGNHSPTHPLDTLLGAARELATDPDIAFVFVGGGGGKAVVEDFAAKHPRANLLLLPYQPLADLKYSLSAADLHVVSMGSDVVGMVHPCKIYGAMSVARPILAFGPESSHITELIDQFALGWHVSHGDVAGAVAAIRSAKNDRARSRTMGANGRQAITSALSKNELCGRFTDVVLSSARPSSASR